MVRQWLRKRAKNAYGAFNTCFRKSGEKYNAGEWFDKNVYNGEVSDRKTISQDHDILTTRYHYASVELCILRHLSNYRVPVDKFRILDIGSGSGHWIDFYNSLGSHHVSGLDIALSSFRYLTEKYARYDAVDIFHGKALEVIKTLPEQYDLVNAIGVLFHIVDDIEWRDTVNFAGAKIKPGGVFIIGGHFGHLNGLNVQIDKSGAINKRLRSKKVWIATLKKAGFRSIRVYRNYAYLHIRKSIPENNILIATK